MRALRTRTMAILLSFVTPAGPCAMGCSVTPNASIRSRAESKLWSCVQFYQGSVAMQKACVLESRRFCKESGLEIDCGEGALW